MSENRDPLQSFGRRRRHLPHWEAPGETYFLTFTLRQPPVVDLTRKDIAPLVVNALQFFDGECYLLFNWVVMPDHVHLILKPMVREGKTPRLSSIMHSLKGWLATKINEKLGRKGPLWCDESFDHILRDEADYITKAAYIYDNPRRAGLVKDPAEWPCWGVGSVGNKATP